MQPNKACRAIGIILHCKALKLNSLSSLISKGRCSETHEHEFSNFFTHWKKLPILPKYTWSKCEVYKLQRAFRANYKYKTFLNHKHSSTNIWRKRETYSKTFLITSLKTRDYYLNIQINIFIYFFNISVNSDWSILHNNNTKTNLAKLR